MNTRDFLGYRGTDRKYAALLKDKKQWKKSVGSDEYFGHGIYFFEEDAKEAFNFAKYTRKIPDKDIAVIQALLKCDRKEVLDLINADIYQDYLELIIKLDNVYKKEKRKPRLNHPYDCKVINMICNRDGYKMVRGAYNPRNAVSLKLIKSGVTRIAKTHIQLCVREESIINDFCICCF